MFCYDEASMMRKLFKWNPEGSTSKAEVIGIGIIIAIIVLSVGVGLRRNLKSPTTGSGSGNPVLIWSITDHDSLLNPLPNDPNDQTLPQYDSSTLSLKRTADSSVKLPRFQGKLEYRD